MSIFEAHKVALASNRTQDLRLIFERTQTALVRSFYSSEKNLLYVSSYNWRTPIFHVGFKNVVIPTVKHHDVPKNERDCKMKLREYFYRNACVTDVRVIDILVIKVFDFLNVIRYFPNRDLVLPTVVGPYPKSFSIWEEILLQFRSSVTWAVR